MAAQMGCRNIGQWMERAASNQLKADREAAKVQRYRADRRDAEHDRHRSMPYASDYGLPADFDIPAYSPPSAVLPQFRK